ncbi:GlcG/HbpS family heme-binding protein [Govanella unica]|uniref:Heme-binding protein n=1 Tax=Govanella unica TaxID=2975056 RepID=A0A9X3TYT8_9PROT|nr:heme-binding protein [Govania unica]MDA5193897.1 heme-binding protein [Govania unica]
MLTQKYVLTLDAAKKVAAAAEAEALRNNWRVAIAIVDDGGHLLHMLRLDGTQSASASFCINKAKGAIGFKRPTKNFQDAYENGKTVLATIPGLVALEGGLPLLYKGDIVGAIGVSGVQSFEDGIIAKAGADLLATLD